MKAAVIGAGKIGRGFIGQVLHEQGVDLTFVDVSEGLVRTLNDYQRYPVYILGADEREYWVWDRRPIE